MSTHFRPGRVSRPTTGNGSVGRRVCHPLPRKSVYGSPISAEPAGANKYGWTFKDERAQPGVDNVEELPLSAIKRPLEGTRSNDSEKVAALMESIQQIGQQEPVDVLLVDGQYYGFSGCHRFEACRNLGKEKILAKVRKANRTILKMHYM